MHTPTQPDPPLMGPQLASGQRHPSDTPPWERNTQNERRGLVPPAWRIRYAKGWGSWTLCHCHNLTFPLCPTKARCILARVLSWAGWGLIHLSLRVGKVAKRRGNT